MIMADGRMNLLKGFSRKATDYQLDLGCFLNGWIH